MKREAALKVVLAVTGWFLALTYPLFAVIGVALLALAPARLHAGCSEERVN